MLNLSSRCIEKPTSLIQLLKEIFNHKLEKYDKLQIILMSEYVIIYYTLKFEFKLFHCNIEKKLLAITNNFILKMKLKM